MEISAIFGKARMDKCAAIHNRTFLSNLPSIDHDGKSLESIVLVSNPDLWNHKAFPPPKPLFLDDPFYEPPPSEAQHRHEIEQALDLLKRCLALDPCKRITAADALKHPWLRRPGVDEDADAPRKPLEGVCRRQHRIDEDGHRALVFPPLSARTLSPLTLRTPSSHAQTRYTPAGSGTTSATATPSRWATSVRAFTLAPIALQTTADTSPLPPRSLPHPRRPRLLVKLATASLLYHRCPPRPLNDPPSLDRPTDRPRRTRTPSPPTRPPHRLALCYLLPLSHAPSFADLPLAALLLMTP